MNKVLYAKVTKFQDPVLTKILVVVGVRWYGLERKGLWQVTGLGRAEVWGVLGSWLSWFLSRGRSSVSETSVMNNSTESSGTRGSQETTEAPMVHQSSALYGHRQTHCASSMVVCSWVPETHRWGLESCDLSLSSLSPCPHHFDLFGDNSSICLVGLLWGLKY